MGWITRFGNWLDHLFEPKATQAELKHLEEILNQRISNIDVSIPISIVSEKLTADMLKLRDELTAIKALYKIGGSKQPTTTITQKFDGSQPWKR